MGELAFPAGNQAGTIRRRLQSVFSKCKGNGVTRFSALKMLQFVTPPLQFEPSHTGIVTVARRVERPVERVERQATRATCRGGERQGIVTHRSRSRGVFGDSGVIFMHCDDSFDGLQLC